MNKHFKRNNLLTQNQFAYQSGKGTNDAIKLLISTVGNALEDHRKCAAQLCDLSRAFDSMPHAAFLNKMEQYGIRGVTLKLIKSYLTTRMQRVEIGNKVSTFQEATVGVPQGSLLGGVFLIIYTNDLPDTLNCTCVMYADDTTLITTGANNIELQSNKQRELAKAKEWFTKNTLSMNDQKTQEIIFEMDRWQHRGPAVRFLGVQIDPRLTWLEHVETLCKQLSKATYAIRRLQKTSGIEAARIAYFALFHSRLKYGIEVWGHSSHTKVLLVTQKRAVRALTAAHPEVHAKPLFQRHNILTIHAIYLLEYLCSIRKAQHQTPKQADRHGYETRSRNDLSIGLYRLATTAHSGKMIRIYNSLPLHWKSKSQRDFKNTIKQHLLKLTPYSIEEFSEAIKTEDT